LTNDAEMAERMKWRYRLEWREDKRLGEVISEWKEGWGYWMFIEGSVSEQLELEEREGRQQEIVKATSVLDKISKELDETPENTPIPNRDKWKTTAMDHLAKIHQTEYENNGAITVRTKWFEVKMSTGLADVHVSLDCVGPAGHCCATSPRHWPGIQF
jgi:hypothetical protein